MKKRLVRFVSILTALTVCVFPALLLCGCSFFSLGVSDRVEFTRSSVTLGVGETYDLSDIIYSDTRSYTLKVMSGDAHVSLSGTRVKGISAGTAVIAAETMMYSDTVRVRVVEAESDSLVVEYDGALTQTVGKTSDILFTPVVGGSVKNGNITWYVNGDKYTELASSDIFAFQPTAAGEYVIRAEGGGLTAEHTVRAYYAASAELSCEGALDQPSAPFTSVVFSVDIERDARNPDNFVEWLVDGDVVKAGAETRYVYNPTAGVHTVGARVNGDKTYAREVRCVGSVTPTVSALEYDNMYPHAYLRHDAKGLAAVEITSPTGTVAEYSQSDARYADLFGDNGFDVGELISLCAEGASRRAYRFRVKSLGDGDALTESAFSPYYTFTQLPAEVKPYLQDRYMDKDHYITSDYEFANVFEYNVLFRSKTERNPRISYECYIAFETDVTPEELWSDAFEVAATSGMYNNIKTSLKNSVFSASCTVDTINTPSVQSCDAHGDRDYATQLHAFVPHINYDESKYRDKDYKFPIDECENTQSVEYTDELYMAVENNTRPLPKRGSAAETVYELARDVLRKICTDDMTDMEKAHAIYDWIMWQVTYDTPAADSGDETYSAYYLEGVFGDGVTEIGGKVYKPYAVCDGMSKAYSIMCNMEGVPCKRVSGTAGVSLDDAGGHAWNKVFVNGGWYVVDCTWGDTVGELNLGIVSKEYELSLHDHLFLTDGQADETHFEPYESGDSSIIYVPETPARRLDVYRDMTYNGVKINCSITRGENAEDRLAEIGDAFARAYVKRDSITVPGGTGGGKYKLDYEGLEIHLGDVVVLSEQSARAALTDAIRAVKRNADVRVFAFDGTLLVLMRTV